MARTLLIVDDIRINREILKKILGDEYDTIEAADGQEALAVMARDYKQISAVLLDLGMPVMDGFAVLRQMRESETLSQLPVIVTTGQTDSASEERALQLGAKDYISKPYKSTIIKQRIWNTIHLRETAATINAFRRDRLTGLLSREAFFEKVAEMVAGHEAGYYVMACFDIDNFKVINDQYGTEKGDELLRYIAGVFQSGFTPNGGLCCRVTADNFAVLYPASFLETAELAAIRRRAGSVEGFAAAITFSVGRYVVDDRTLSPSAMYDRAALAEASVKGRYDESIAFYDESMRGRLLYEQEIVTEMTGALKNRQFEVWFQPQYNHSTGALIGAEALVRWRHPEKGLIPPGSFIPIFEKNGFVYALDRYVWEETCRCLRKWLDEGRRPLPVSVNVSRYDVFRPELVGVLTGLVGKYNLPVELLRLEITESAFAQNTQRIVQTVKRLIDFGFTVEIDDFGSGYSSLNTLKSVPAQVVKLDMRFLSDEDGAQRGGNILESIVRMTKWLGMSVIAEGVETREQADFLKSIGCGYVQGYLYARPMPMTAYEAHCRGAGKEERLLTLETVENLDNNAFWNPHSMDSLIFNSYVGAACIFEYFQHRIELLRANDKFAAILGDKTLPTDEVLKLDWIDCLTPESLQRVREVLRRSGETGREMTEEYVFTGIPGGAPQIYLRATMRVIASVGERKLVYCMCENITAQRQAEQSERRVIKQLQAVLDNVDCGITAVQIDGESVEYLLSNDRYYELLGYTRAQYWAEIEGRAFATIHPEDRARLIEAVERVGQSGLPTNLEYRVLRRDKSVHWMRSSVSMADFEGVQGRVQLCTYVDVTSEKQAAQDLLDNLPGGAALYTYENGRLSPVHLNKRYWELVDRAPVDYAGLSVLEVVYPDDRAIVTREIEAAIAQNRDIACDIRLRRGENGYRPFHAQGRIVPRGAGKYSLYASYTPISDEAMSIQEMLPIALTAVMASSSDLSFVKDRELRYICCSRAFAAMAGLKDEKEVVGKTDAELFDPEFARPFMEDDRRLMQNRESIVDRVERLPSANGQTRYSSTSKYLLYDSRGNVVGIYGTGRDITEDREIKSQLELLTNNIPGGIAIYAGRPEALDSIRLAYFSDGFCRLFGYSRPEYARLTEANPLGLVFAEDVPALMEQVRALLRDETPMDCVYRARVRDGGYKWINIKAVPGERRGEEWTVNAVLFDVTARQETLERLRMSEEENRLAMRHSGSTVCRYDVATRTLRIPAGTNPAFALAERVEDVPESQIREGRISPETSAAYAGLFAGIRRGEKSGAAAYQRLTDRGYRWLEAHYSTIFSDAGEPVSAVLSVADVTERLEKEQVFKRWRQSLNDKEPASYALLRVNVGKNRILEGAEGLLLARPPLPGRRLDEYLDRYAEERVVPADWAELSAFWSAEALLASYYKGQRVLAHEYREALAGEDFRWLRLTVDLVESPHSSEVEAYLLFEDIDQAKRAELTTIARAESDPLTGVMNRVTFAARIDRLLRESRPNARHALLMLDIDGFKMVNDAFGHGAGDAALVETAQALRSTLGEGDLLGRLGGDEFVVFLKSVPSDAAVAGKARQICALTRKAFSMEVEISASVGITIAPRDGMDFETLYKKADSALYYVKGSGKDNYAFYHAEMADEHLALEADAGARSGAAQKRRMLIVDDSRIDHAMLSEIFAADFVVDKARDGASALIRMRHYGAAISVVLLDLMMPGMDGFAVLKNMRQSAELRNIPVVVVSGDENRETSLRAIRAGASDFVTKPVDPDVLRIRVQSAINKTENERLRAKNSFLEYQNSEVVRYKTVLEHMDTVVVEHDWIRGVFTYDPAMSDYIAGIYDDRKLWHILLADLVADTGTVRKMQELVHEVAAERKMEEAQLIVRLRTPNSTRRWFRMGVYKTANSFGLTDKIYLAFQDLGAERPAGDA